MLALLLAFTIIIDQAPVPATAFPQGGTTLIELQPIVRELGATFGQFELTQGWRIEIEGHTLVFGTDSQFVVVDGELKSLSTAPVIQGEKCFLPLDFYDGILCPLIGAQCRSGTQTLIISRRTASDLVITGVQLHYLTGFTKLVIMLEQEATYSVETENDTVRIAFRRPLYFQNPLPEIKDPLVRSIVPGRQEIIVQLLNAGSNVSSYTLQSPFRIVLDISRAPSRAVSSTTPARQTPPLSPSPPSRFTVVLDPGHGGKDTGARNGEGLTEKDLTLRAALKVRRILADQYGYDVVMTRQDDIDIDLDERTAKANEVRAHAFISIHANSARTSSAHGAEVYYLTLDTVDRQLQVLAEDENLSPTRTDDIQFILWDLAQSATIRGSASLADLTARSIADATGLPERGVKQAPFRVLMGATMPAILIELGFLTNPKDVEMLQSEEYLTLQAQAVADAVHQFQIQTGDRWFVH
ncbi:MAG TPA: N-acetylmuramoyl-L-alanine amidase [Thermoanaerobaculia bacterium]|nr:N-acetylmuramoyl-L-alanine amidase [Thermoanaerobaculia bacterium]HUM31168.1 N-acetylmuramoyl-L-alanine amidase [Thermoanaerobaculia bacterium]HXK69532.1 N-acetylmuramoyl-L-alanine amidase [Thermoanaerobaculia bacterium]